MRAIATGMNHPLRNALVVEVKNLFAEVEVVHDERAARPDPKRILIVGDGTALCCRQHKRIALCDLMQLATLAALHVLVVYPGGAELVRLGLPG